MKGRIGEKTSDLWKFGGREYLRWLKVFNDINVWNDSKVKEELILVSDKPGWHEMMQVFIFNKNYELWKVVLRKRLKSFESLGGGIRWFKVFNNINLIIWKLGRLTNLRWSEIFVDGRYGLFHWTKRTQTSLFAAQSVVP